jgi:4-hydroxyacetophenone monooxygenase
MTSDRLQSALSEADIPILLMSLVHLTGDRKWIEPPFRPVRDGQIFADESGGLPEDVQAQVRAAAAVELARLANGEGHADHVIDDDLFQAMMSCCVGEPVDRAYVQMMLQEMGLRSAPLPTGVGEQLRDKRVVVIGAGVSGVCAAIKLHQLGIDYTVLEKNPSVGGTWFENTYPEAGVDTPNHFYSYSFAASTEWTSYFSKQQEILGYIDRCVDRYDVRDNIRFGVTVQAARYDEQRRGWTVELLTEDGTPETVEADLVITAVGLVNNPKLPDIDGLETFAGEMWHTARWPAGADLTGKRVGMIGMGASGLQVARSVAADAASLTIFQRSPQWITPNRDYHRSVSDNKRWLLENVPFYAAWYRFALFWRYSDGIHASLVVDPEWPHQERSVNERNDRHRAFLTRYLETELEGRPDLIELARPTYPPYGKRMLVDNDWFRTLRRDNVELVGSPVTRITERGVETADGRVHELDVIVLATGFHTTRSIWPLDIVGRTGESIHDYWQIDEMRAYLGMTVPGYPNLFMLLGPNTGLAHGGSVIFQIETQMQYVIKFLEALADRGAATIECRAEAYERWIELVDAAHAKMVFSHPGMTNWYKNRAGRITTITPFLLVDYWSMTQQPVLEDFVFEVDDRAAEQLAP